jgi:hypothetical protein
MLSLAIGREGQNARLAAKLTGWRIDIRSDVSVAEAKAAAAAAAAEQARTPEPEPVAAETAPPVTGSETSAGKPRTRTTRTKAEPVTPAADPAAESLAAGEPVVAGVAKPKAGRKKAAQSAGEVSS